MEKIIVIDFAGTFVKAEVIEAAQQFRTQILQRALPSLEEHANPDLLYKANRLAVAELICLADDAKVQYLTNDNHRIELTGEQIQNQISTNLFQIGMYMAAKEFKLNMIPEGFIEVLQQIKREGYKLAIVSGVREDIISGMFTIAGIPSDLFEYIRGQPPILGVDNDIQMKELSKITYIIGDKISDIVSGPKDAKKIFVTWGHATGGEEALADFVIKNPEELLELF